MKVLMPRIVHTYPYKFSVQLVRGLQEGGKMTIGQVYKKSGIAALYIYVTVYSTLLSSYMISCTCRKVIPEHHEDSSYTCI